MRRLALRQLVSVDLAGRDGRVDCRVGAIAGGQATLVPVGELSQYARGKLQADCPCYLVFEDRVAPVGLRGTARATGDGSQLFFAVGDGVQLSQRRGSARVPVRSWARVTPIAANGSATDPVETTTVNLSLAGALVEIRPGIGDGPDWRFEVRPSADSPILAGRATLVRRTPTCIGVALGEMTESDRLRLATFLLAWRRPTGR